MSGFDSVIRILYLLAAAGFVVGLHLMNSPATARRGNRVSMWAMVLAVAATLAGVHRSLGSRGSSTKPSSSMVHRMESWPLLLVAAAEPHSTILAAFHTGPGSNP